jgi:hypothetical protein
VDALAVDLPRHLVLGLQAGNLPKTEVRLGSTVSPKCSILSSIPR